MNNELIAIIPTLPLIQNVEDINESTRIEQDLKLQGPYAMKFLLNYSDIFKVDISHFRFNRYFHKDIPVLSYFTRFFGKRKRLTLGDLEQAIAYGKLNDEVFKEIREKTQEKYPHKRLYFKGEVRYKPGEILVYVLVAAVLFVILSLVAIWV
ncbi:hypothetical protein [Viscerimonas tarda]